MIYPLYHRGECRQADVYLARTQLSAVSTVKAGIKCSTAPKHSANANMQTPPIYIFTAKLQSICSITPVIHVICNRQRAPERVSGRSARGAAAAVPALGCTGGAVQWSPAAAEPGASRRWLKSPGRGRGAGNAACRGVGLCLVAAICAAQLLPQLLPDPAPHFMQHVRHVHGKRQDRAAYILAADQWHVLFMIVTWVNCRHTKQVQDLVRELAAAVIQSCQILSRRHRMHSQR